MVEVVERLRTVLAEHYAVDRELGRGGMATVYLARDLKHGRFVAIKVLRPTLAESLGPGRFLREISIASRLVHPNILPVHDSGNAGGLLFYVMPYVSGENLRDLIHRVGQLPVEVAVRIAQEVAQGLTHAHREDVVHRDIKPENILLESGHAVIADFGLARAIHASALDDLSSAGLAIGTPSYMSPEQAAAGDQIDGRSDIYSLGCVLYEMLAGEPPFTGPSAQAVAAKHLHLPPPPLHTLRPTVPDPLVAAIDKALEKLPADRFQTAAEFSKALTATDTPGPKRSRRRALRWGALVLSAIGAVGMILVQRRAGRDPAIPTLSGAAPAAVLADPTHIAVLYFDAEGADTAIKWVANGLTEDLIDQLGHLEALSVISANGVRPYREHPAAPDSIARALSVGTLVAGTVAGSLDQPRVTVRLIEASGRQVDSKVIDVRGGDVLALRSELAQEVAGFLRQRLGREIKLRELRSEGDARAWLQVRGAEDLRADAWSLYAAGDTAGAQRTLGAADSMLGVAEKLDPGWLDPIVLRGWTWADRIDQAEAGTGKAIAKWAPRGIAHAERALARKSDFEPALELRGYLRFMQWKHSENAKPDLVEAAERDLRAAAATENPSQPRAWSTLSFLLQSKGSFAESNLAAKRAYKADAFLTAAPAVMFRLYFTSVVLRRWTEAADWCAQGHTRFPTDWLFTFCQLTLLYMPSGQRPDGAQAWRLASELDRLIAPSEQPAMAPRWRMLIAAVLARAGERDSARHTIKAARAAGAGDLEMDYYEAGVRALLGEPEQALDLLERYVAYSPASTAFMKGDPFFDPIRAHPRFQALVASP